MTVPEAAAVSWTLVAVSAALAVACSPLLAGWTIALRSGVIAGWWKPRRVTTRQLVPVAAVAGVLGVAAGHGGPWLAWWLLAIGGTVLAIVDAECNLLPARLVYPLAAAELVVLAVSAAREGDFGPLLRGAIAASFTAAGWFALAVAAGGGIGFGDVRLAALTSGMLAWVGWDTLMRGQLVFVALTLATALVIAVARPQLRSRAMRVPLGPAMILATLVTWWVA